MNERIKELAEQSGFEADSLKGQYGNMTLSGHLEKFAELIVRELSAVADNWVNHEDDGKNLVSDTLKKYFGVKE